MDPDVIQKESLKYLIQFQKIKIIVIVMSAVLKSLEKPQHHECGSNTANKKECFEYHKKSKSILLFPYPIIWVLFWGL